MRTAEVRPTQKESMLSTGKAMSRAPIMSGIRKLPKHPTRIGMTAKKIMMVACMVKKALSPAGVMLPPGRSGLSIDTHPKPGTGPPVGPFAGQASSQRTRRARMPPIMRPRSPRVRNCLPIILWSVEKMYWRMKPTSWGTAAWRASTWVIASLMTCRSSVAQRGRREQRAHLVLTRPGLVLLGRLHVEPAPHPGVAEAAELGAGDLVLARPDDLEPGGDRVPGHCVLLEAGARDEEAVDHVARLEQHPDRLVDGDVDVVVHDDVVVGVELAVRARVGDLPVELLGGH